MRALALLTVAMLLTGCGQADWEKISAPDIRGSAALASVESFVATNGWNMYTNGGGVLWEYEEHPQYITGLPWSAFATNRFQATTRDGILYVMLDPGWHHDYSGVAYNPHTNRFPDCIRGFKPIGEHWYVWCQPEFWAGDRSPNWMRGRYE